MRDLRPLRELTPSPAPGRELTVELRFHFADDLDTWVDLLLEGDDPEHGREAGTNEFAKRHQRTSHVKDPYRLRVNA